jgi:hypothetical protein
MKPTVIQPTISKAGIIVFVAFLVETCNDESLSTRLDTTSIYGYQFH